jgi:pimeloyl-ACP methyl ester carboxylesterase
VQDTSIPWAVGGHSLGGVAASSYARTDDRVQGLVLWGSFPVDDLSGRDLAVASVTGSADGLSTPAKVDERRPLLPPTTVYTQVPGGIHSFFGDYGLQPGDGVPGTSRASAQAQIVAATVALLEGLARTSG